MIASDGALRAGKDWKKITGVTPAAPKKTAAPATTVRPAAMPSSMPIYAAQGTIGQPKYIPDSATQDAVGATLANTDATADVRGLMKQTITPGRSMGKGDEYRARVQSSLLQQAGRGEAADIEKADIENNSKRRLDYEYAREMEAQKLAMIQHAAAQAAWADQFTNQRNAARMLQAKQNAQLGLLGPMLDFLG